jgi:cytochrome c biogenesis protein CcmG, thiol:disulfide interchange protein DsbE
MPSLDTIFEKVGISRMSESTLSLRQIGVVLLLCALAGWFLLPALGTKLRHAVGDTVPDFSLPVVVGGENDSRQSLQSLRGKVVLMDFWASWCGPCRQSLPVIEHLAHDRSKMNLVVLGINQGESPADIRRFYAGRDPGYSILSDADGAVSSELGINGLPTMVVVDAQGKLRGSISGVASYARLERLVDEAAGP